jgi:hypothetical protein
MLFISVLSFLVLSLVSGSLPELKWITPADYSWGQIDPISHSGLPLEVSCNSLISPLFLEYRLDSHDSPLAWTRLSTSRLLESPSASPHWTSIIPTSSLPITPGVHYLEARVTDGPFHGPCSAVFYSVPPPTENLSPSELLRRERAIFRKLILNVPGIQIVKGVKLSLNADPLARVEYSVGATGAWSHAGDFAKGELNLDLPLFGLPQSLEAGAEIPIRFRAFDGVSWTSEADQPIVTAVVNARPSLELRERVADQLSVVPGEDVALPVGISDADSDRLHVLCVFDGGQAVAAAAHGGGETVVLPASVFEGRIGAGEHTLEVYAFDGFEMSAESVAVKYVAGGRDYGEGMEAVAVAQIAVGGVVMLAVAVVAVVWRRRKAKLVGSGSGLFGDE